ncbi:MAG: 16S rRNA (cytosine(1402)-N(4))-methyltransferase RsmH [Deltaproteobacteria bacterium]|nr:16S rRNA (cytosine(1402)-N(4))-methyltransferase RsmH [Deltaproteobacteria bacterium]
MEVFHRPVMTEEVVSLISPQSGGIYVDATLGGSGHAVEILKRSGPDARVVGIDRDEDALCLARRILAPYMERITLVHEDYRNIKNVLAGLGIKAVDGVVFDLGISSFQLHGEGRGFSFQRRERLDMRIDRTQTLCARDLVNTLSEKELERVFRDLGEERHARAIARAVARQRERQAIETTDQLSAIVEAAVPRRLWPRNIHPATRVFQALRIAVNDELEGLKQGVTAAIDMLSPGARIAVISFHSLEDRIVKNTFNELAATCVCPPDFPKCVCGHKNTVRVITKRAVRPTGREVQENPRARSAVLRSAQKI